MVEKVDTEEKYTLSSISINTNIFDTNSQSPTTQETTDLECHKSFNNISSRFTTLLLMLWKYMSEIGNVSRATSLTNMMSLHAFMLDLKHREIDADKSEEAIAEIEVDFEYTGVDKKEKLATALKCKIYEQEDLDRINEYKRFHDAASRILYETALQHIVNSYEQLLSDMLSWQLNTNPDAASQDQKITYKDLLTFSSLEEAKKHVIDNEITAFLKTKSTDEQLKYLNETFKVNINSHFSRLPAFKELILRRHTIVHAGGIATAEYMRNVKKIKGYNSSSITNGQLLSINNMYIVNAWSLTYALGVIILHLVGTRIARIKHDTIFHNHVDSIMINTSLVCIKEQLYDAAQMILNYAKDLTLSKESNSWTVLINLAQTLLWQGKKEECFALLEKKKDWKDTSPRFQLCIAALHNNIEDFKIHLRRSHDLNEITLSHLIDWPVFKLVRKSDEFLQIVEELFGKSIDLVSPLFAPQLIDFQYKNRLKQVIEYINESEQLEEIKFDSNKSGTAE